MQINAQYPLTCQLFPKDALAGLNQIGKKICALSSTTIVLKDEKMHKSYLDLQNYHFTHLQKELLQYDKNEWKKVYLSAAIIAACLIGIVVHPIFGFASLGIVLVAALYNFPYEQPLLLERIKYRFENCEAYGHILAIKHDFISLDPKFTNVTENFFFRYYQFQQLKPKDEEWQSCLKAILDELKQNKDFYDEKGEITHMALECILKLYDEFH